MRLEKTYESCCHMLLHVNCAAVQMMAPLQSCYGKLPWTWWLKSTEIYFIFFSKFWGQEIQDLDVDSVGSFNGSVKENLPKPVSWFLGDSGKPQHPLAMAASLHSLIPLTNVLPSCVCRLCLYPYSSFFLFMAVSVVGFQVPPSS